MTNEILFKHLIDTYNEKSFTHNYIFGFVVEDTVYNVKATSDILPYVCKIEKAGLGNGYALRFRPNKKQKMLLLSMGAEILCSKEYFDKEYSSSKYNRGETHERLTTEAYGQEWKKDNTPFTEDGDITVDGIAYQLKFEKATFCNEKSLANLG